MNQVQEPRARGCRGCGAKCPYAECDICSGEVLCPFCEAWDELPETFTSETLTVTPKGAAYVEQMGKKGADE